MLPQGLELSVDLFLEYLLGVILVCERFRHEGASLSEELRFESALEILSLHRFFHPMDAVMGACTRAVLGARTEEVEVLVAMSSDTALNNESPIHDPFCTAPAAVDGAFQEVMVLSPALTRFPSRIRQALYCVEEFGVNDWLVAPWIQVAFVAHHSDVIRVSQHEHDLVDGDRNRWPFGGGFRE
nr:hypothetical protein [Leucobacter celer]